MNNPLDIAVVFACDFRPRVVNGVSVMPNHGRAAGAPAWLTLGDGTTATTFPTPLAGWGASFDGGDYVNTGVVDRYERTGQFSLYWYGEKRPADVFGIIGNSSSSHGILLEENSGNTRVRLVGSNGTLIQNTGQATSRVARSFALTFSGSAASIKHYINGSLVASTTGINNLNASIKNGCPWALSTTYWNPTPPTVASGNRLVGDSYAFGIFDGLLTPRDVMLLDTLVRGNIR